jgi:TolB protein
MECQWGTAHFGVNGTSSGQLSAAHRGLRFDEDGDVRAAPGRSFAIAVIVLIVTSCGDADPWHETAARIDEVAAAGAVDTDILVVPVPGDRGRVVVSTPRLEATPDWSPDGRQLAYARLEADVETGNVDIWLADVERGSSVRLVGRPYRDLTPAWSPDGRRIAFTSDRTGDREVWVREMGDGRLTQVTDDEGRDMEPRFSPDGRRLVFVRHRRGPDESPDLWLVGADGGPAERLTSDEGQEVSPTFSPDGEAIAYVSRVAGHPAELRVLTLGGGPASRVGALRDPGTPAWSPDGARLAVRDGTDGKLHVVDVATGRSMPITQGAGDDFAPTWSPDGRRLAYASSPRR